MSQIRTIDEILDELGFQSKPGSTKGRMYSSRFYHAELKQAIKDYIAKEIIGEDSKFRQPEDDLDRGIQIGYDTLRNEQRQRLEEE